jgi:hypothetical protein
MSKIYKCIDCGKEYTLNYTEKIPDKDKLKPEEYQKIINDFNKSVNFPTESNICIDCLDNVKLTKIQSSNTNNANNSKNSTYISKQFLNDFKEKYSKDFENLQQFTEEGEQSQLKELEELKKKVDQNESSLNSLLKELENIEEKETQFCDEFRDLEIKLYFAEKDISKSNDLKIDYENKIKNINDNNIFTELFQISFNEKYGVINGCKFNDPTSSSNYDSINAGIGYIILLTKLLSIKFAFDSSKYDLIPEGNFSKIIEKGKQKEHELGLSDMNRTKEKFNEAMSFYLYYLSEFINHLITLKKIQNVNEDVCPKINGKQIKNKSIEIDNSKDKIDDWYQCMKYLLTILKFLICQVLTQENDNYKENIDDPKIKKENESSNDSK